MLASGRCVAGPAQTVGLRVRAQRAVVARRLTRVWRALEGSPVRLQIRRDRRRPGGYLYSLWLPRRVRPGLDRHNSSQDDSCASFLAHLGLEPRRLSGGRSQTRLYPARMTLASLCCSRSFIRGLFLSRGTLADPSRLYQVELTLPDAHSASLCVSQLRRNELRPKLRQRPGGWVVYVQDAAQVVAFLGLIGATGSMMELENQRVMREIRGNVNRLVNSETANVRKTVQASWRLQRQIDWLVNHVGWERLSPSLAEAARLRLAYPELTLAELGRMTSPPLSKSAINHRLRRLAQLAAEQGYVEDAESRSQRDVMVQPGE
ncbi:MAG: DNA-binding protein WhiA [Limnochordaceae bacterium]|nr:DNA-binding protein WhiA [Limnochordaceae bacterium]